MTALAALNPIVGYENHVLGSKATVTVGSGTVTDVTNIQNGNMDAHAVIASGNPRIDIAFTGTVSISLVAVFLRGPSNGGADWTMGLSGTKTLVECAPSYATRGANDLYRPVRIWFSDTPVSVSSMTITDNTTTYTYDNNIAYVYAGPHLQTEGWIPIEGGASYGVIDHTERHLSFGGGDTVFGRELSRTVAFTMRGANAATAFDVWLASRARSAGDDNIVWCGYPDTSDAQLLHATTFPCHVEAERPVSPHDNARFEFGGQLVERI